MSMGRSIEDDPAFWLGAGAAATADEHDERDGGPTGGNVAKDSSGLSLPILMIGLTVLGVTHPYITSRAGQAGNAPAFLLTGTYIAP
jgi:hypothetical protein